MWTFRLFFWGFYINQNSFLFFLFFNLYFSSSFYYETTRAPYDTHIGWISMTFNSSKKWEIKIPFIHSHRFFPPVAFLSLWRQSVFYSDPELFPARALKAAACCNESCSTVTWVTSQKHKMDFTFSGVLDQHKRSGRTPGSCKRQSSGLRLGRSGEYCGNDNEAYSDRVWDKGDTKGGHGGNVNGFSQKINKTARLACCLQVHTLKAPKKERKKGTTLGFLKRNVICWPKIEATRTWWEGKCGRFEGH